MNAASTLAPPRDEDELLARAHALAGRSLRGIAAEQGRPVPASLKAAKGFVGQLIEVALGADASTLPLPDFVELGV